MHAIIRKGNGEYYISAVFGYYSDRKNKDYYGTYYVVFDEKKEKLIKNPGIVLICLNMKMKCSILKKYLAITLNRRFI